jgi:hypothetical protein
VPNKDPKRSSLITWLDDDGLRGSPTGPFDSVPGVQHDEFEIKGEAQFDTIPLLVIGALGAPDAISGSGPYEHLDGMLNDYTVASQPPSLTIQDFDGVHCNRMTAAQIENLEFTYAIAAALNFSAKLIANPGTQISKPTESFGTEHIVAGWSVGMEINSEAVTTVEEFTCKIDRGTEAVHTGQNTPGPYANFADKCVVTGKSTFVIASTSDSLTIGGSAASPEWNASTPGAALKRFQVPIAITFTEPITGHTMLIQMSAAQFANPVVERGKKYLTVSGDYKAVANATDAVDAGYAPIQIVTTNAKSAAYAGS